VLVGVRVIVGVDVGVRVGVAYWSRSGVPRVMVATRTLRCARPGLPGASSAQLRDAGGARWTIGGESIDDKGVPAAPCT
jgi:hypothetical protein